MNIRTGHRIAIGVSLLGLLALLSTPASAQRPSIAELQNRIADLEAHIVPDLAGYLSVDLSGGPPTLRVSGANFQVVNGLGSTSQVNGLGNLIVGYDELRSAGTESCSTGFYTNEIDCTAAGATWALNHKSGSHNLVVGRQHNYSRVGGLIAGAVNTVSGTEASVLGGQGNMAREPGSTVSGGRNNVASGAFASVSGGLGNRASSNEASVSGGTNNTASGLHASVSGGSGNLAAGSDASVSGGQSNSASDAAASVSGGSNRNAVGQYDWRAGTLFEDL